uniref:Uncharacterized protein n=1 Tax=Palpitomonas bilix TaxID=652834 RepID=A0A7S3DIQ3_9EUKA|mmetsp:Transcript_39689/g.102096  ORF Transcript_39689/g.102096 Transcript_39689/m.102096 type:complete len:1878 (+) Transcript_39689:117-5750(+)
MAEKTERQKIIEGWMRKLAKYQLMFLVMLSRWCGRKKYGRKRKECCGLGRAVKFIIIAALALIILLVGLIVGIRAAVREAPRSFLNDPDAPSFAHQVLDFEATYDLTARLLSPPSIHFDGSTSKALLYRISDYVRVEITSTREVLVHVQYSSDNGIDIVSHRQVPLHHFFHFAVTVRGVGSQINVAVYLDGELIEDAAVTGVVRAPYFLYLNRNPKWVDGMVIDRTAVSEARVWTAELQGYQVRLLSEGCIDRVVNATAGRGKRMVQQVGVVKESPVSCSSTDEIAVMSFDQNGGATPDIGVRTCSKDTAAHINVVNLVRDEVDMLYLTDVVLPFITKNAERFGQLSLWLGVPDALQQSVHNVTARVVESSRFGLHMDVLSPDEDDVGAMIRISAAVSTSAKSNKGEQSLIAFLPRKSVPAPQWLIANVGMLCQKTTNAPFVAVPVLSDTGRIWSRGLRLRNAHVSSLERGMLPFWNDRGEPLSPFLKGEKGESDAMNALVHERKDMLLPSLWGLVAFSDDLHNALKKVKSAHLEGIYADAALGLFLFEKARILQEKSSTFSLPFSQSLSSWVVKGRGDDTLVGPFEPLRHDEGERSQEASRFIVFSSNLIHSAVGASFDQKHIDTPDSHSQSQQSSPAEDSQNGGDDSEGTVLWVADCGGIEAWEGVMALSSLERSSTHFLTESRGKLFLPPSLSCHRSGASPSSKSSLMSSVFLASALSDSGLATDVGKSDTDDAVDYTLDHLPLHLKEDAIRYRDSLLDRFDVVIHTRNHVEYGLWVIEEPHRSIGRYGGRGRMMSSVALSFSSHLDSLDEVWTPYLSMHRSFLRSGVSPKKLRIVHLPSAETEEERKTLPSVSVSVAVPGLLPPASSSLSTARRLTRCGLSGAPPTWPITAWVPFSSLPVPTSQKAIQKAEEKMGEEFKGKITNSNNAHHIQIDEKARPFTFLFNGPFTDESGWTDVVHAFCTAFSAEDEAVLLLRPIGGTEKKGKRMNAAQVSASLQYNMYKAGRARDFELSDCGKIEVVVRETMTSEERTLLFRSVDALLVPAVRSNPGTQVTLALAAGLKVFGPNVGGIAEYCRSHSLVDTQCYLFSTSKTRSYMALSPNAKETRLAESVVSGVTEKSYIEVREMAKKMQKIVADFASPSSDGAGRARPFPTPLLTLTKARGSSKEDEVGSSGSTAAGFPESTSLYSAVALSLAHSSTSSGSGTSEETGQQAVVRRWTTTGEGDYHRSRLWYEQTDHLSSVLTRAMQQEPCTAGFGASKSVKKVSVLIITPFFTYTSASGDRLARHAAGLMSKLKEEGEEKGIDMNIDVVAVSLKNTKKGKNVPFLNGVTPVMVINPASVADFHAAATHANSKDYDAVFVEHDFALYAGVEKDTELGIGLLEFVKYLRPSLFFIPHDTGYGVEKVEETLSGALSLAKDDGGGSGASDTLTSTASSLFSYVGYGSLLSSSSEGDMFKERVVKYQILLSMLSFYSVRVLPPSSFLRAQLSRYHNLPLCHTSTSPFYLPSLPSSYIPKPPVQPDADKQGREGEGEKGKEGGGQPTFDEDKEGLLLKLRPLIGSWWSPRLPSEDPRKGGGVSSLGKKEGANVPVEGEKGSTIDPTPPPLKSIMLVHAKPTAVWGVDFFIQAFTYAEVFDFEVFVVYNGGNSLSRSIYRFVRQARRAAAALGVHREVHFIAEDAVDSTFDYAFAHLDDDETSGGDKVEKKEGDGEKAQNEEEGTAATAQSEEPTPSSTLPASLEDLYSAASLFVSPTLPSRAEEASPFLAYAMQRNIPILSTATQEGRDAAAASPFSPSSSTSSSGGVASFGSSPVFLYDSKDITKAVAAVKEAAAYAKGVEEKRWKGRKSEGSLRPTSSELDLILQLRRPAEEE